MGEVVDTNQNKTTVISQSALSQHHEDSNVSKHLSHPHDKCGVVPADKVPNNIVLYINHIT